jgi:uncharacterized membrane protein
MKAQDAAKLGVRLIGLAAVVFGCIGGGGIWIFQTMVNMAPPATTVSLHETTYTHVRYHFEFLILGAGLIVIAGIVLIVASRSLSRLLIKGLSDNVA